MNTGKVLITGSTGFVGRNLVSYLNEHHFELYTVDRIRNVSSRISGAYTWDELTKLPKVDCILHLAGKAHDTAGKSTEQEYISVNVGLTKKITDWFIASGSKTLVYLSSIKAVADVAHVAISEDLEPKPTSLYGCSKLAAEHVVSSASVNIHQKRYILRPCLIYGPENKGNLNLLFALIKRGIPYPFGAFSNQRSYLSVKNLNYILLWICMGKLDEGTYHIADRECLSTTEVVRIINESLNRKGTIWYWNKDFVKKAAKLGSMLGLRFNSCMLEKLTGDYLVSTDKLSSKLNSKLPVNIKDGLLETFKSFQV